MTRPVEISRTAWQSIFDQLDRDVERVEEFTRVELVREIEFLAEHFDTLPVHDDVLFGSGRRLTQQEPQLRALSFFHLFARLAEGDMIVVYHVDIWLHGQRDRPS